MASNAVLVTGCSSGIGRASAERLARSGRWTVYATARRKQSLEALRGAGCETLALDVTDAASMAAAVRAVEQEHGSVAALVNNAGYSQSGAVEEVPLALVREQFETNVFGLVRMCQLVLPGMRAAGAGRIVNVSSMGGRLVFPGGGVYHASKYAVEALSDALRFEVRGFGVQVSVIQPGLIRTRFAQTAVGAAREVAGEGPYGLFNSAIAATTAGAYHGAVGRLGGGPDTVAKAIQRALERRRAPARVRVTPSASLLMGLRSLMGDGAWDAFLRRQYPTPRA